MIMLIWRIWSLRSDLAHGKNVPSTSVSADYLQSYMCSLDLSRRYSTEEILKGKMPLLEDGSATHVVVVSSALPWSPPPTNRVALSVDGTFSSVDGSVAAGMILRRHDESVVFAAYRCLFNCNDALEAELHALMQGMNLAAQYSDVPIIVQLDSSEALASLNGDNLSRSAYGHLVAEIKHLMVLREFILWKIKRGQNRVTNWLALYSRIENATAVWLDHGSPCIEELLSLVCNLF